MTALAKRKRCLQFETAELVRGRNVIISQFRRNGRRVFSHPFEFPGGGVCS